MNSRLLSLLFFALMIFSACGTAPTETSTTTTSEPETVEDTPTVDTSAEARGRNNQRRADLQQMATALEFYDMDHGSYPTFSGCITEGSSLAQDLSLYLADSNMSNEGVSDLCENAYFYHAYESGKAYVLAAELETKGGLDVDSKGIYCSISGADFFSGAQSLQALEGSLAAQTCDESDESQTSFYVLTHAEE